MSLVAVVGDDFPGEHREYLAGRGIDIAGLEAKHGKTFRWRGRYSDDLSSRTTLDTQLNVFADFKPVLPQSYRKADLLFLGNIHPSLQLEVLDQVERPKLVAMDTMNFWIGGELPALKKVLARVDTVILNDEEARQLSGEHNLPKAARAIHAMGPRTVIVKRGDAGALLFYWQDGKQAGSSPHAAPEGRNGRQAVFAVPAYPLEQVVDPTGAGDTFAGGFMGSLARSGELDAGAIRFRRPGDGQRRLVQVQRGRQMGQPVTGTPSAAHHRTPAGQHQEGQRRSAQVDHQIPDRARGAHPQLQPVQVEPALVHDDGRVPPRHAGEQA